MLFDKDSMIKRHISIHADLSVSTVSESGLLTLNAKTVGTDLPTLHWPILVGGGGAPGSRYCFLLLIIFHFFKKSDMTAKLLADQHLEYV